MTIKYNIVKYILKLKLRPPLHNPEVLLNRYFRLETNFYTFYVKGR